MNKLTSNLLIMSSLVVLSACGTDAVWQNARSILSEQLSSGKQEIPHTREEVENIPYASIVAQLENTTPALMILGYVDGERLQWISSNNVSISTKAGRIVHTVGFEKDISYLKVVGGDFLGQQLDSFRTSKKYQIIVETNSSRVSSETLNCEMKFKGEENITILNYSYDTQLLEEKCKSSQGWTVKNQFWVDEETGFVWRSRQGMVNGKYTMEINILKPFG